MQTAARRIPRTPALLITILLAILVGTFGSSSLGRAEAGEVREITLPIHPDWVDSVHWTDSWGAPRSGGRSHIGVDMMGPKMTPLVAARSGEITWGRFDNSRGSIIRFRDHDGWEYQYIHLNNDTPGTDNGSASCTEAFSARLCGYVDHRGELQRGIRLEEGEVIAYSGDSGNAEWTGAHVHFEIYKPTGGGTTPINPTPSVDAALDRLRRGVSRVPGPQPEPRPAPDWAAPGEAGFADHLWYQLEGRYPTEAESVAFAASQAAGGPWGALGEQLAAGSTAAAIDRLYQAFFLRYPDTDGLRYWIDQRATGMPLEQIAEWWARSEEMQLRFSGTDPGQLIDQLYRDVLGREPDPGGWHYWLSQIEQGHLSRGSVVVQFTESEELKAKMAERNELVALRLVQDGTVPTADEVTRWRDFRASAPLADAIATWFSGRVGEI